LVTFHVFLNNKGHKMPDIPLDAVVANRFISSLSKSLQALCHGCMDFDSGIEIGGYLFVKIDCDTKVDYVLEEKVEKGSNNSMKFVSNSYLSKKDQLKQTRDGSCSPVLELQSFQQPPKTSYQYPGAPHHRSQFPYSPQPHVSRGAHKRSWPGMERDWRPSPKKPFQPSRMPQPPSATATQSSHNRNPLNPAFLQPHPPSSNNVSNNNENVNVKREALDGDDRLQGSNQLGEGEGAEIGFDPLVNNKITIKNEPGGLPEHEEDSNADGEENFLQQSENSGGASHTDSSSSNRLPQRFENDNNSNSAKDNAEYQSDYEGAEGDVSYGQSSLDEQGEGATPGEGPGFDVIEIDDEDEDVKAMFGNQRVKTWNSGQESEDSTNQQPASQSQRLQPNAHDQGFPCPLSCFNIFNNKDELEEHIRYDHKLNFPYICTICGKGYNIANSYYVHMKTHSEKAHHCYLCDKSFTRRFTKMTHLKAVHGCVTCPSCHVVLKLGLEYDNHVGTCCPHFAKEDS